MQEGKEILGDEPIAQTRSETKALQETVEESKDEDEPASKKRPAEETSQVIEQNFKQVKGGGGVSADLKVLNTFTFIYTQTT